LIFLGYTLSELQESLPEGALDKSTYYEPPKGVEYKLDESKTVVGMSAMATALFPDAEEGISFFDIKAKDDITEISNEHSDTKPQFELDHFYPKFADIDMPDGYYVLSFIWRDMQFVVISADGEVVTADTRVVVEYKHK
jgi:hypothetical protein